MELRVYLKNITAKNKETRIHVPNKKKFRNYHEETEIYELPDKRFKVNCHNEAQHTTKGHR